MPRLESPSALCQFLDLENKKVKRKLRHVDVPFECRRAAHLGRRTVRGVSGLGVGAMHAKSTILYRPGCGVQTSVDEGEDKVVYLSYDFFVA